MMATVPPDATPAFEKPVAACRACFLIASCEISREPQMSIGEAET